MEIKFIDTKMSHPDYYPKPASEVIPDWYKKTSSYINGSEKKPDGNGGTLATVKRCMPVFDAITAGYILFSVAEIYVSQGDGGQRFEWSDKGMIDFHPVEQAPLHPAKNEQPYPKWMNPFGIKTPPGYSTLFVQPFHRESLFTILPGIVDTDKYTSPVNFPFVMNDVKFEGYIPAGTPIAQVIPFKRDDWDIGFFNKEELDEMNFNDVKLRSIFYDRYKKFFRTPKLFK